MLEEGLNNRNATGIALGPGIFRAECTVKLLNPQGQPVDVIVSGTCAVVGGPIRIEIVEGSEPTWHHDGKKLDRAWFIEYFGYSHYALPTPPWYIQKTQDCFVSVLPQPEGTVVTWFGPSQICSFILDLFPHAEGFDLAAEASFSDVPINAEFFLLFTPEDNGNPWPEPIGVTGEDDSKNSTWLDSDAGEYKQVGQPRQRAFTAGDEVFERFSAFSCTSIRSRLLRHRLLVRPPRPKRGSVSRRLDTGEISEYRSVATQYGSQLAWAILDDDGSDRRDGWVRLAPVLVASRGHHSLLHRP